MTRSLAALAALALGGCSTVGGMMDGGDAPPPRADATLTAIQNARVRDCPAGRTLDNARLGSDPQSRGVESVDIALTTLASDPSRAVRLRRITVQPGGIMRVLLERAGRRPVAILLTHAHIDHAYAAGDLAGDDVPVFIHQEDAVAYEDIDLWNPGFDNPLTPVKDLRPLVGGETLAFAGFSIGVRHTPGHTPGHCCFVTDATVMAGDLVFAGSIGRSDLPNSSPTAMRASLEWFLTSDDAEDVLPGHGPRTTVGRERASNPFLVDFA